MTPARNTVNSSGHVRTNALDLDALQREGDPGPFVFSIGGREYDMADPQSMDYRDLVPILTDAQNGEVKKALDGLLDADDVEAFWGNRLPAFKLNALCQGWLDHYGLS